MSEEEKEDEGGLIPELREIRDTCLKKKDDEKITCTSGIILGKHYDDIRDVVERMDDITIDIVNGVLNGLEPTLNGIQADVRHDGNEINRTHEQAKSSKRT